MISETVRKMECENEHLKDENEKLRQLLGTEPTKQMNCGCCTHFLQHYIKCGTQYVATFDGHCIHGRVAKKKPDGKTCPYFELGRKHYF